MSPRFPQGRAQGRRTGLRDALGTVSRAPVLDLPENFFSGHHPRGSFTCRTTIWGIEISQKSPRFAIESFTRRLIAPVLGLPRQIQGHGPAVLWWGYLTPLVSFRPLPSCVLDLLPNFAVFQNAPILTASSVFPVPSSVGPAVSAHFLYIGR